MNLSVIVCTRNRAAQLFACLSSMTNLRIPDAVNWELIIVDNGSTDNTGEIVNCFRELLPLKRVFQPEPGRSNALNLGINTGAGEYFIFTDDDVLVDANWLSAYAAAFRRWPAAAVFGGKVTPVLKPPTPEWFHNAVGDLGFLLAARDFGFEYLPLSTVDGVMPFGANYAVRAAEQKRNFYDPTLGVAPGRHILGEETAVIAAILNDNNSGFWLPDAEVRHIIPSIRQTTDYIFTYYEGMGRTAAYLHGKRKCSFDVLIPVEVGIKLPLAFLRFDLAQRLGLKSWVRYFSSYAYHHGRLRGWLSMISGKKESTALTS